MREKQFTDDYTRIGGWLLIFIIGLAFLGPLLTAGRLVSALAETSHYSDKTRAFLLTLLLGRSLGAHISDESPALLLASGIDGVIATSLTIFGVYTWISL